MKLKKEDVKGLEFKHATYATSNVSNDDALFIKEYIHTKDGDRIPNFRMIENYKRDFWVTKPAYRNHKDKKEWEEVGKLKKFSCTQRELPNAIAKALGTPWKQGSVRHLARDPYLYGCDIGTPSIIKYHYQQRWKDCISPTSTVAALDIETDIVHGDGTEVITITISYKEKIFVAATKKFLGTIPDPHDAVQRAFVKYLHKYKNERNITMEFFVAENPGEACAKAIQKAHEWKPDFVSIWNMDFDLPRIVSNLEKYGYSPAEVFSDPKVPKEYRFYDYKRGNTQKVTATGKVTPIAPYDQWHIASFPATWYAIDSMCVYRKIRFAKGQEPDYTLDGVLGRNLNLGKLNFDEVDHLTGLAWHFEMQTKYKIEYIIYNIFDCIGLELLDEKTGDLSKAFSLLCGYSEYGTFASNPRKICDDLHFFCLERGLVIGTTSDMMEEELDKYVVSMTDWIVTLPSEMMAPVGLNLIQEMPHHHTSFYAHVSDLDIEGTYPNVEDVANISKETTRYELAKIEGIDDITRRYVGVDMTAGPVNAIELCRTLFDLPTPDTLLEHFKNTH